MKRSSAFNSASAFFASKLCRYAGAIHHDLCGHRIILRCKVPEFYAGFRLTRKPDNGTFAVN
jgi:hypothetical protein